MSFVHPGYLWLVIVACVLTSFLSIRSFRTKRRWLKEYRRLGLLKRLGKVPRTWGEILRLGIINTVVLGLGLVLLTPTIETTGPYFEKEKLELVFALDASRSMLAEDPSRLEVAKFEMEDLVIALARENLRDLVGLVVFASEAFLLVPPTYDYEGLFLRCLATVDEGFLRHSLPQKGTNIGEALRESFSSFAGGAIGKTVIILTDGEPEGEKVELEESMAEAIKLFSKTQNISVYIIGVGDPKREFLIPTEDKKDFEYDIDTGRYIRTRPNPGYLRQLAGLTGGTYIHSATAKELRSSLKKILEMERKIVYKGERSIDKDISQYILGLVLVLLLVYCILTLGKIRKPRAL